MQPQQYTKALESLNKRQKEAVQAIEGPVMVIAGPGTGKTQILSMRIAHILAETDTPASGVLALTFTESGAASIKKRLLELIGKDAYEVSVYTFHGFSNSVIQTYPDYFPKIIGGRQCEPIEQIEIIRDTIESNSFEYIKPFGNLFYYVRPILSAIQDLKREGYTPDKFEDLIKKQIRDFESIEDLYHNKGRYEGRMKGAYVAIENKIKKNNELLSVYREYERVKQERGLYDYDDMILEVLRALESDEEFLLMLQEKYLYILADEHQDTNRSQNRLLELLASFHDNPNIFVVGDDKQAIYRFQGASLENFLYFKNIYPEVKVVELEDNYRSTQHILDISSNLIANNPTLSHQPLKSTSTKEGTQTTVTSAANPSVEAIHIADKIKDLIEMGEQPEEIAVLFRNNSHSEPIRDALISRGIDYSISGIAAEAPHVITEQFIAILEVVQDPTDEARFSRIFFYSFFELEIKDIFAALEERRAKKISFLEFALSNPDSPVSKVISTLGNLHKKSANLSLRSLFDSVLSETNIMESILKDPDSSRALSEIKSLFSLAKTLSKPGYNVKLSEYLSHIERAREYNLPILSSATNKSSGVQLMTVHRSKGLEFNSVFVLGATDSNWGGRKKPEYFHLPELKSLKINEVEVNKQDERRLFYVALTRAKQRVFLTYPLENESGREELESQFISELGEDVIKEELISEDISILSNQNTQVGQKIFDKDLISTHFFKRGLSATAVNKYLRCSWDYFFTSLIRVPQTYSTSAIFGTAMHSALQKYFEGVVGKTTTPEEGALEALRRKLFEGELEEDEAQRFYKRGEAALEGYFKQYSDLAAPKIELEKTLSVELDTSVGRVRLTGNLDKVETDSSGEVVVTDFKTGKPKSRNVIEGKTKNSDGNYKRQLVFYALLLNEVGKTMSEGVIDFVEPNERGIYKRESFFVNEEEISELKKIIDTIGEDITSLSFVEKGCREDTCEWCKLSDILLKNGVSN